MVHWGLHMLLTAPLFQTDYTVHRNHRYHLKRQCTLKYKTVSSSSHCFRYWELQSSCLSKLYATHLSVKDFLKRMLTTDSLSTLNLVMACVISVDGGQRMKED